MDRSDAELVQKVVGGDVAAFGQLYDRYARLVRAVSFDHVGDVERARDMAQETFLRAYRALGDLRKPESFAPWLLGIARRVAQESLRAQIRDARAAPLIDTVEQAESDRVDLADELQALRRALLQLDEAERLAVHAVYLDEHAPMAAAQMLGLSRSGFYKLLARARDRLRRLLAPVEDSR